MPLCADTAPPADEVVSESGVADEIPWAHSPFEQRWCSKPWRPVSGGRPASSGRAGSVARLPWVRRRRLGVTVLTQAPLTRFVGPWIQTGDGKYETRLGIERELMAELIANLPRFDVYRASFAPAVTNWLPFYWAGFDAMARYTYRWMISAIPIACGTASAATSAITCVARAGSWRCVPTWASRRS
jgi:hypothetical protein